MKTKNAILFFAWIGIAAGLSGCAALTSVPPGLLYTNVRSPRAYRSATPGDVQADASDPRVTAQSCSRSVLYLISWGNNGYAAAVDHALKDNPAGILYDVQVDARTRSILMGLYNDTCTILTGRVGKT